MACHDKIECCGAPMGPVYVYVDFVAVAVFGDLACGLVCINLQLPCVRRQTTSYAPKQFWQT